MKSRNKFARIITVDKEHQVLLTKLPYNEKDKCYEVKVTTCVDGGQMSVTLGNKSLKTTNHIFKSFGEDQARQIVNDAKNLFE